MFGAVEITRERNHQLREKAGREGFATNEAYRQFRAILQQFLVQVAAEFFREGGGRTAAYAEGRLANERLEKARRVRSSHVRVKRQDLRENLDRFFAAVDAEVPQRRVQEIVATLCADVASALHHREPGHAAALLATAESAARRALHLLDHDLEVRRPRGVALSADLSRDIRTYDRLRTGIRSGVLAPAEEEIERVVAGAGDKHLAAVQRRLRFDEALQGVVLDGRGELISSRRALRASAEDTRSRSSELAKTATVKVEDEVQSVLSRAARLDVSTMSDAEFIAQRGALERATAIGHFQHANALQSVAEQLRDIAWPVNGTGPIITAADQVEELETRLEAFLKRAEQDLELTQIGLAVEMINHEFQTSVRTIRQNLVRLRDWADSNHELRGVYSDLRSAFDHLDGYLKLFTPLHRRLYRNTVDISGRDLEQFVRDIFRSASSNRTSL